MTKVRMIGYVRVSTEEQNIDRQYDELAPICDEIYIEKKSAIAKQRPVYDQVMARLQSGDVFVIWDLDRAYRSARDALNQLEALKERNIDIKIANMQLDTSTPYGKFIYTMISALAELERNILSKRTKEGLAVARRNGKQIGGKRKMTDQQIEEAIEKLKQSSVTKKQIAVCYGVHPWTLTRSIKRWKLQKSRI